jgi:subtilisin family serine protease
MKAPAAERSAAAAALLRKADRQREVRVIAGLRTALEPPHTLSATQAGRRAQRLRAAQDAVLARALGRAAAANDGVTRFDVIPFVSMFVNRARLERLLADPDIVNIQEDVPLRPILADTIPLIKANGVWNKGFPGTGIVVAILDTGVRKTHPMFAGGKVVSEACYSTTWGTRTTSFCPGGAAASTAAGSGVNCPNGVSGCNHGTAVASVAAGSTASLKGVARAAKIISIQVSSRYNLPSDCGALPAPCAKSWTRIGRRDWSASMPSATHTPSPPSISV